MGLNERLQALLIEKAEFDKERARYEAEKARYEAGLAELTLEYSRRVFADHPGANRH